MDENLKKYLLKNIKEDSVFLEDSMWIKIINFIDEFEKKNINTNEYVWDNITLKKIYPTEEEILKNYDLFEEQIFATHIFKTDIDGDRYSVFELIHLEPTSSDWGYNEPKDSLNEYIETLKCFLFSEFFYDQIDEICNKIELYNNGVEYYD